MKCTILELLYLQIYHGQLMFNLLFPMLKESIFRTFYKQCSTEVLVQAFDPSNSVVQYGTQVQNHSLLNWKRHKNLQQKFV